MHVFGYGSLLTSGPAADGMLPARLRGFRRRWGVAMDNRRTIAGYKVYVDAESGDRPPVYVTFLDIAESPSGWVNGVVFPVDDGELAALDRRERNYERCDVSGLVDGGRGRGRVWAYTGRMEARDRYRRGAEDGSAVVSRPYLEHVRAGFAALGGEMLRDFDRSTDPPAVPLRDLRRVDL